ncbi:MAG: sigma-54-dependent Fis family transcriptional regulator [Proteobacteria bacterium]|nr:sigma-54-dependent Fis family transcriptional regulator [Pseudomonadota bacterium]
MGETPVAWAARDRIAWVAARKPHVLILGASGTGKELAANAIHRLSDRGRQTLVARNAATLPESLVDAELFGNVRDYPNPGMVERTGLIGAAHESTLFLDEIAELPERLQSHLLRVLDEGDYQRLGESRNRIADFRLVAATNRPVSALKHDLLARLKMRIELPGLDARRTDVPLLARHLVRRIGAEDPGIEGKFCTPEGEPRFTQALMQALLLHPWSYHVRELDAVLWASIGSSASSRLELTAQTRAELDRQAGASDSGIAPDEVTAEVLKAKAAMEKHQGVRERVWRELGLKNRWVLGRLLKKHGL